MSEDTSALPARPLRDLIPAEAWQHIEDLPTRPHRAADTLLRQGEGGHHVLALVDGLVKVVHTSRDGRKRLLAFRGPGELLGEMALQDGGVRTASVHAITDCKVKVLLAVDFRSFVEKYRLAPQLAIYAVSRVREQTQGYDGDTVQRLAAALLRLVEIAPKGRFSLTRDELAQHLGVGRRSIAEALTVFGPECVTVGRAWVEVLDPCRLRALAGGEPYT
ncbi:MULTISPECIES: cyclic nucleotide-binding domain-containing protein [Streptomyces]|uniref:Cyclic nucleotide-binding domain-containing protein n=1 Tax=Streptomyces lichenis TaxID=2306967 RepID=A0ABT0I729_9ACTN|nr:cyclic nucleotide-binding domain-containing protein [Streptomyces lichenis]MCK8677134.1 cyclic nucleotide-binding domain-containing protein [Streptomyces lichenis]